MKFSISTLFLFFFISSLQAQTTKAKVDNGYVIKEAKKDYGVFNSIKSKALGKTMPMLVFLPTKYATSKKDYPVVYMLHGMNDQEISESGIREMLNSDTKMLEYAEIFQVIIVAPIQGNSYYIDSPLDSTKKFATFTGQELPNFIDKEYRTIKSREGRFLAGFSMGGYGAVSLLCRYPETFSVAINRAGVMDLATGIKDLDWDEAAALHNILGNYWDNLQAFHLHGCFNLVNKIANRKDVAIVIEVGREDFLYTTNQKFNEKLKTIGIPFMYIETPGGHSFSSENLLSMLTYLQFFRKTI